MQGNPFTPQGGTFIITVGVANQSVPVVYAPPTAPNLGLGTTFPPQIRLFNHGTVDVWINFSGPAAGVAIIPVPGTVTMGTPGNAIWVEPNVELIFSIPCIVGPLTGVLNTPTGFWMNVIAGTAAQPLSVGFGDGG